MGVAAPVNTASMVGPRIVSPRTVGRDTADRGRPPHLHTLHSAHHISAGGAGLGMSAAGAAGSDVATDLVEERLEVVAVVVGQVDTVLLLRLKSRVESRRLEYPKREEGRRIIPFSCTSTGGKS